jgi:hypothetical protein
VTWLTPSLAVSTVALSLSLCGFLYTWRKDREQNRRWDSLNLARFSVRNLRFMTWREIDTDECHSIDWGYPDVYTASAISESGVIDSEKVKVPVGIVAYHPLRGLLDSKPAITTAEMKMELVKRKLDPAEWKLMKRIKVIFSVENVGSTTAYAVSILAEIRDRSIVIAALPTSEVQSSVGPGELSWSFLEWSMPLESLFPPFLALKVDIRFRDAHGVDRSASFQYQFERTLGSFRRA